MLAKPSSARVETPAPQPTSSARRKGAVRPSAVKARWITCGCTAGRERAYPAAISSLPNGLLIPLRRFAAHQIRVILASAG